MPIYAYRCDRCGVEKDVLQKLSDAPLTICPECGAERFHKRLSAPAFQLKGSGWYVTDFRDGGRKGASDASPSGDKADAAGESGKAEAGKVESGKAESGKAESGKVESGKVESGKAESGKAESGKAESGKAEMAKTGSGKTEPGKAVGRNAQAAGAGAGSAPTPAAGAKQG